MTGLKDDAVPPFAIDYDIAKGMARSRDPGVRRQLAARGDIRPELLYFLATDVAPEVRREIAANAKTPRQADLLLSRDTDTGVRTGLARKIARLAPNLPQQRLDQIERMTLDILEALARDQTTAVRQILAEELHSVATAPTSVVTLLARDVEVSVCGPVLRNSPILNDDDLLAIILEGTPDGALAAIADRAHVGAGVADAIAVSDDADAIAVLLANPSAQIREETLDRIIDRAPQHEPWHAPLVRRPQLSARAAIRLASFVADTLLTVLQARTDLGIDVARQISEAVRVRLSRQPTQGEFDPPWASGPEPAEAPEEAPAKPQEGPSDRAKRLHGEGKLDEVVINTGIAEGDRGFVVAALAELVGSDLVTVDRLLATHSSRAVTALVWRAGLSMRLARQVQLRMAQIAPKDVLPARNGTDFPLSDRDMAWQLEFFGIS